MGTAKRDRQKINRQQRLQELARDARRKRSKRLALQFGIGIPVAVLALIGLVLLTRNGNDNTSASTSTLASSTSVGETTTSGPPAPFSYGTGECAAADGSSPATLSFTAAPKLCIDPAKAYTAAVTTNKGTFTINLDAKNAPGNVNNFVNLARFHYYDNHDCHRIIENFVVQCGRPGDESKETAPGYTVGDEVPVRPYQVGDIAVANTGQPNTGGGQFFIITGAEGAALPSKYSLIGSVADGLDATVQAMAAEADPEAANGVPPKSPVTITSVTITEA